MNLFSHKKLQYGITSTRELAIEVEISINNRISKEDTELIIASIKEAISKSLKQ